MPRYDDRYGNTRLYVGRLSSRTRARDLEHIFSRYGRVRDVDMKRDYAFVEFSDPRDADDARYYLDGRDVDGSRIAVEHARGVPRGSREYVGRGPPPGTGRCFNCGLDGHWARDCKAGDWKNKCYRCGERGHIERNCTNSPKTLSRDKRGRSYSRSPVRSRSPRRGRSRSYSRDRSYSRSRSPLRRERSVERDDRYRSPEADNSPPPLKGRRRSETPDEESPVERGSPSPDEEERPVSNKDDDYADSPTERGRSPVSPEREESPEGRVYRSPSVAEANGRSESPSPRDASPVDDGYDDPRARKGSDSP